MEPIIIHKPIWKTRSIGIAEHKIGQTVEIKIDYRTKDGQLMYPHTYIMRRDELAKYPVKVLSNGIRLRIVPIGALRIKE